MKIKIGLLSFVLAIFVLSGCLANNAENTTETEEYLDAYCTLVSLLWEKTDFIRNNNDSSDDIYSNSYKANGTISKDTEFVNNELLGDASLKIGMTRKDVYNLLGVPDSDQKEYVAYYRTMYVKDYYAESADETFYASTSILFDFDEKESIIKIVLNVEAIEDPWFYWGWGE